MTVFLVAKVDVVIPCYNYGRYLEACVRSVLNQTIKDVRVLVIDDASSDNSASIAYRLAAEDSRISVRVHSQNQGHIVTFNEGIDWVNGDYFLLLSSDDLLAPGSLERATHIMDDHADVVLVHGKCIVWEHGAPFPLFHPGGNITWRRQDLLREMCATGGNLVQSAVTRTSVQKAIGGFSPALPHSGDMEMWLRFAAKGTVAWIEAVQAIYRRHSSNMSSRYYSEDWGDYWHRKAAFETFFENCDPKIPDLDNLRLMMTGAMAEHAVRLGAKLVRSGIRLAKWDRVDRGLELLRLSTKLNPRLRYSTMTLCELFRLPGPEAREWFASAVKQTTRKLLGRIQQSDLGEGSTRRHVPGLTSLAYLRPRAKSDAMPRPPTPVHPTHDVPVGATHDGAARQQACRDGNGGSVQ